MTPAAAFEELRRELARLGVAVVKDAIRRLVKLEQALEVAADPPLRWAYRSEPLTPDPAARPSQHVAPWPLPDYPPLHVEITAEQVANARERLREIGLTVEPPAEQQRADLLAMVRDEHEQDSDDEEAKP